MPRVTLRLRNQLKQGFPEEGKLFELAEGTTLGVFLADNDLAARHYVVILNNTVSPNRDEVLKEGDRIIVYPQMAGG